MSINNINKNILSVKILDSINTNLGVDNSYASSKTKLIADALSEEIANISSSTVTTMDRYSVSTANGFYLDIIGSEENIYRNKTPYITSDENVSYIYPLIDGDGFDDLLIGKEIIQTGEQVTVDSNYIVTFLRPVVVVSKFSNVQCYIRLEAYDVDSNIYINKDTSFTMSGDSNPYLDFVKLKIMVDINNMTSEISDDEFRVAIQKKKVLKNKSALEAINTEMLLVQNLNGYSVESKTGDINIFIVTNSMIQNDGLDSKIDKYKSYIKAKLNTVISAGININVTTPDKYILQIVYENINSSIPAQIIKDVIVEFFRNNYIYAEAQSFDSSNITRRLHLDYPSIVGINITKIGLFDPILNKTIIEPTTLLTLDRYSYITLNTNNIIEE